MGGCMYLLELVFLLSSNKYLEVGLLDLMVALFLIWGGNFILFAIVVAPIYIPTNNAQAFRFLYILGNTCYFLSFENSHSNKCVVISHCGFDLHFPVD